MSVLTAAAIIGAYTYMFLKVRFTAKPRSSDKPEQSVFGKLAIAAGILLLGGMVHTDGTIPPIQFAAYGMILISMAIHTAQRVKALGEEKAAAHCGVGVTTLSDIVSDLMKPGRG